MSAAPRRRLGVPEGGFRRIAVIRLSSLGDVILTLPVVDALAAAFPNADLTYWVKEEFGDVVRFHPGVTHVRSLESDARRIEDLVSMSAELEDRELIVDLHGNARSRVLTFRQQGRVLRAPSHRVLRARWVHARWTSPRPAPAAVARFAAALAPLGLEAQGPPRVEAGPDAERWAEEYLAAWPRPSAPVAIAPAAKHATKRWPEERWLELDRSLAESGRSRLYFSLASERRGLARLSERVDAESTARWVCEPLARIAALLSRCSGAVGGDTGLMHLAAARGLRVVVLFGSTSPVLGFGPSGEGHAVICRNEPCQPCTLHGRERCPLGHFRCMLGIAPGEVMRAIEGVTVSPPGARV